MELNELIQNLKSYSGLACDSRKVVPENIFVAVSGSKLDGTTFIAQAIERGAKAIVAEVAVPVPPVIPLVIVPSARRALAELAKVYYDNPSQKLKLVGITGTNGKTTIAYLLNAIFKEAGFKTGLITTVENVIDNESEQATLTTPDPIQLNALFAKMIEKGVTHAVMEVSSHALDQERALGIDFDAAVFTNLTHDHLDYHKDIENYFLAKRKLFLSLGQSTKKDVVAVINGDDAYGLRLKSQLKVKTSIYSKENLSDIEQTLDGMKFFYRHTHFESNLTGDYNASNLMAAILTAIKMEIPVKTIKAAIKKVYVPGRFERIGRAIIDFAHSPDALEKLLRLVRSFTEKGAKIVLVFGCPGDRDRDKRPIMGEIADKLADLVIITTDDPHTEDPNQIAKEVAKGAIGIPSPLQEIRTQIILDRYKAIEKAFSLAHPNDWVVIAGRGHEKYQDFNGKKVAIDDRDVAREIQGIKNQRSVD